MDHYLSRQLITVAESGIYCTKTRKYSKRLKDRENSPKKYMKLENVISYALCQLDLIYNNEIQHRAPSRDLRNECAVLRIFCFFENTVPHP